MLHNITIYNLETLPQRISAMGLCVALPKDGIVGRELYRRKSEENEVVLREKMLYTIISDWGLYCLVIMI